MDPSVLPQTRIPVQTTASRLNGARSAGPVTMLGKVATAAEAKLMARLADTDFRQGRLARAEERLVASTVEDQVKGSAAQAALAVELAIAETLVSLKADVDRERDRLTELVLFGDGDDARRLDRHRGRLGRELEQHARALKSIRELAAGPADGGSGSPVTWLVELRVVGRAEPR